MKTTRPATSHIAPFGLRMQPELRAKLEAAAARAGRSLNAELVARLEESIQLDDRSGVSAAISTPGRADRWAEHLAQPEHREELIAMTRWVAKLIENFEMQQPSTQRSSDERPKKSPR